MKKIFSLLTVMMAFILLTGFTSGKDDLKEKVFVGEVDGMEIELTYYYKGDQVLKQKTVNKLTYESLGVEDEEGAREILDPISETMQDTEGLKEKLDYKDDHVIETVELDFEKGDINELAEVANLETEGDLDEGISMKKSEEFLLEQGFKEKK
ncbi:DUF1307 domain-containing protein [Facklamia sp. DSM 111018]|uniref:DUF1307 domain-containing protein n=1 Tax=Facklamia lactis TaxID=2749967 RepID=A0ABS0LS67_9LACT|nr:DUF1307 domain-containing protein [Facklamia lactis]MBG9981203.1 DUF1307 domain-containing protein [Facklamia lactis]MBG9987005.1 DUF1307 domain-containing protein [Facklamia lactis]